MCRSRYLPLLCFFLLFFFVEAITNVDTVSPLSVSTGPSATSLCSTILQLYFQRTAFMNLPQVEQPHKKKKEETADVGSWNWFLWLLNLRCCMWEGISRNLIPRIASYKFS